MSLKITKGLSPLVTAHIISALYLQAGPREIKSIKSKLLVFMRVLYPDRIGIWRCWCFVEGGKPENPKKHLRSKTRQATKSAHIRHRARSNPCGRRTLSPLRYPCSLQCFEYQVISRHETAKFIKKIILR